MRKSLPLLTTILLVFTLGAVAFADDVQAASGVVNINTADASQLAKLPRVGTKAAQRIIDYRTEHGPFQKSSDLMQVKGFGDKRFEQLRPYIVVEGKTTLTEKVKSPRKPRTSKASTSHPNTAN